MNRSSTLSSRIGLISDTHGLLRPEAVEALRGCDRIIHAGDIGKPEILDALAELAPLTVVRGNNDRQSWAEGIPETAWLQLGPIGIQVLHDLATLDLETLPQRPRVVISGHSHKPLIREHMGLLSVNPGSAGPRRFKLPVTVAELQIAGDQLSARILSLECG